MPRQLFSRQGFFRALPLPINPTECTTVLTLLLVIVTIICIGNFPMEMKCLSGIRRYLPTCFILKPGQLYKYIPHSWIYTA